MEEILASIRKIIAEEPIGSRPGPASRSPDDEGAPTALPLPGSVDGSSDGPPYSVEDALADLMDDAPQRRSARAGGRDEEPAPELQHGRTAPPSEAEGQHPSWHFGRAAGAPPAEPQAGLPPDAGRELASSLRGQLDSMRPVPVPTAGEGGVSESKPDAPQKPEDARSLFDRPRGAGPLGVADFPTLPASQPQDLPRPAPQRVPARDPSGAGAPVGQRGPAAADAPSPAGARGASEAPHPTARASGSAPEAGARTDATRKEPVTQLPATPADQPRPVTARAEDRKERDSKPVSPPMAGGDERGQVPPRAETPQQAAPAAPRPSEPGIEAGPSAVGPPAARTLEDTVAELLRPMLREWLDANMPRIVEKALRVELAASAKRPNSGDRR